MERRIRTRFAPSPTGMLHIGGVRTALYNYLLAKKCNGDFILRIEDTDKTRFVPEAQNYIINTLKWLNIMPNEGVMNGGEYGPYIQSERKDIYKKYAQILVDNDYAYYAFDTNEELGAIHESLTKANVSSPKYDAKIREFMKNSLTLSKEEVEQRIKNGEKYVIRFKTIENEKIRFSDEVRGIVTVDSNTLDDKILLKSDGMATYHLASVVDDILMKISHVIRGEEWLPSAPLHILIYRAFYKILYEKKGHKLEDIMPKFVHLPLLLNPTGQGKLSKRDAYKNDSIIFPLTWFDNVNNTEVLGFREKGFLPEAIVNALALLGWNPGNNMEIMSMDELIDNFSLKKLCKSAARFNYEKFKWFNHHYLIGQQNLTAFITTELDKNNVDYDQIKVENVVNLIKDRCNVIPDIWENAKPFFIKPQKYVNNKLNDQDIKKSLEWINSFLNLIKDKKWEEEYIHDICKQYLKDNNLVFKDVMPTFRLILFGEVDGPDVIKTIVILGYEETFKRVKLFSKYSFSN